MKVVFCYQDHWDLMKNEVTPMGNNVMDEQKATYKDLKKKYFKSFFIIYQCVNLETLRKLVM